MITSVNRFDLGNDILAALLGYICGLIISITNGLIAKQLDNFA